MLPKGVLISYDHPTNTTPVKGSGIFFSNGLILTHGTVLVPLLQVPSQKRWLSAFLASLGSKLTTNAQFDSNVKFRVHTDPSRENNVTVAGVWRCPLVTRSLTTLFQDWTVGDVARGKDAEYVDSADLDMSKHLMSVFILLKSYDSAPEDIEMLLSCMAEPVRGEEVVVESTPFGSSLFFNSLSRGIVSNALGSERCLLLTDARTVSGCEGGPIFAKDALSFDSKQKGKLVGLVSCSLTWWRGEWVGLTIGISLTPVLRRLVRSPLGTIGVPQPNIDIVHNNPATQDMIDETVVLVRCGSSWGSGVVVDSRAGVVVTCSHVVRNDIGDRTIVFHKGRSYPARIVYRTTDGLAYDIAVLKLDNKGVFRQQMEFINEPAQAGEAVIAAGFPLLSERDDPGLQPTLVHGCVARSCPSMIQTTCCIQSGASGGPVVRNGKLLGLVVCNAKDLHTGALFPHVNFAIPSSVFRDAVLSYIETGQVQCLQVLETLDTKIQSVWKLNPQSKL